MIRFPQSSQPVCASLNRCHSRFPGSTGFQNIFFLTYLPPSFSFKPDRSSILLTDLTRSDKSPEDLPVSEQFHPCSLQCTHDRIIWKFIRNNSADIIKVCIFIGIVEIEFILFHNNIFMSAAVTAAFFVNPSSTPNVVIAQSVISTPQLPINAQ